MSYDNSRTHSDLHTVAIALGANLGDRFANIEAALRLLEVPDVLLEGLGDGAKVYVIDSSFMYETVPMYVTDQPPFANCACMVETNLEPVVLLGLLKKIEDTVGRVPTIRNGPRAVDLDIVFYDSNVIDTRPENSRHDLENLTGELVVPHPRMAEREFVLRPLNDMIPDFVHPISGKAVRTLLSDVLSLPRTCDEPPMLKALPFPKYPYASTSTPYGLTSTPSTAKYWIVAATGEGGKSVPTKTHIMGTLDVTSDLSSHGTLHNALPTTLEQYSADIIDVSGFSAQLPQEGEEINRVTSVIKVIRDQGKDNVREALISVNTLRSDVAEAAVRAGANCINGVNASTDLDQTSDDHLLKMRNVARRLWVPIVLKHSRGDIGSNKEYTEGKNLVSAIRTGLGAKVDAIVRGRGGVRRWSIIVDPGCEFNKPVDAQDALLRNIASITADDPGNCLAGYPLLVGTSRKSFLGALLERPGSDGTYKGGETSPQEAEGVSVVRVCDIFAPSLL